MRSLLTWVLTAPVLIVGLLAGHALGYRWAVGDPHERAHVLQAGGHGYLTYAPLVVALALSLLVVALIARAASVIRGGRVSAPTAPWLFAVLPPLAFLVQEYTERALHDGSLAWATAVEPAVLAGLALQIPIAVVAVAIARALARLADAVGRVLASDRRPGIARLARGRELGLELPPSMRIAARGWSERGPPVPAR